MKRIINAGLMLIVICSCNNNRADKIQEEIKALQKSYDTLDIIQNNILKDSISLKLMTK